MTDTFCQIYLCAQVTLSYKRKLHLLALNVNSSLCLLPYLISSCSWSNQFKTFCFCGRCAQQTAILTKWRFGYSNQKPGAETVFLNNSSIFIFKGKKEDLSWSSTASFFIFTLNVDQSIYTLYTYMYNAAECDWPLLKPLQLLLFG